MVPFLGHCRSTWPAPRDMVAQLFEYVVMLINGKSEQNQEDEGAGIINKK